MCDYMSKLDRRTPDGSTLALKTLREREAFTRSIITSSPDCIKVLDLGGILLSLLSGNALLGIDDITPLLNTDWLAFWHGDDRTAAEAALQRARAGETSRFVGFFHTFQGVPKWWDVAISPILDARGQPEYLLAVSRDITVSKHAEDALRASEARMRAFISTSSDAFYRLSPDWLEMRHLDGKNFIADTLLPTFGWWDDYLFDADKAAIWAAIQAAIDSKSNFDLEHRIRRIDGTPGWASSHAIPLFDEHGEIIRMARHRPRYHRTPGDARSAQPQ
jgi:PAS domain S-box